MPSSTVRENCPEARTPQVAICLDNGRLVNQILALLCFNSARRRLGSSVIGPFSARRRRRARPLGTQRPLSFVSPLAEASGSQGEGPIGIELELDIVLTQHLRPANGPENNWPRHCAARRPCAGRGHKQ